MPVVKFTANLKRFYPELNTMTVETDSIPQLLEALDLKFPKFRHYIVDEQGRLRKHVNIFIGEELIKDRVNLSDPIGENDEVYIMQALSGG